ncbi:MULTISPECIES: hypothetical protein [unclassified Streptomyces]|uniref:hypothetical protein n=1 Tax=unclassified Streptomyces TaxID=2593676 RepID=UPI000DC7CD68|nr:MULTISPECIES: hypothetical protein [unclassified Streptomyces]AWZ04599.1 hypothetical protein DRB89_08035 [Streptomyces sp. ICC4]AWZ11421.1 hypothetical protein DRB96_02800 [Streptomyces sp. ICC1]
MAFSCRGERAAQLADRLLPVGQLPEQAAHQLVDGGRRAGAEGPRFGAGLGEDVFVQVLEGLTPRSGRSVESGGRTRQRGADEDS